MYSATAPREHPRALLICLFLRPPEWYSLKTSFIMRMVSLRFAIGTSLSRLVTIKMKYRWLSASVNSYICISNRYTLIRLSSPCFFAPGRMAILDRTGVLFLSGKRKDTLHRPATVLAAGLLVINILSSLLFHSTLFPPAHK